MARWTVTCAPRAERAEADGRVDRRGACMVAVVGPRRRRLASILLAGAGPPPPIALFLLAIVIAAVAGGLWAGLIAALLSSLGAAVALWAPRFRLRLDGTEEVVDRRRVPGGGLVVGILVGGAAEERARASRREREARLLGYLSTKLLSGEVPDRVLDDFATVLLEPFGLASVRDRAWSSARHPAARARRSRPELTSGGPDAVVPLVVGHRVVRHPEGGAARRRRPLTPDELAAAGGGRQAGRRRARPRAARRPGAARPARRRDEPAARGDVLLGDPRPADAARLDQGGRDEPARPHRDARPGAGDASCSPRSSRRPTGSTAWWATSSTSRKIRAGAFIPSRKDAGARRDRGDGDRPHARRACDRVTLKLSIADDVPTCAVDAVQIDQVLTNLLENAARHSPDRRRGHGHGAPRCGTMCRCGSAIRARGSPRATASASSKRSIVARGVPRCPGTGLGPRDRQRDRHGARRAHLGRGHARGAARRWCSRSRWRERSWWRKRERPRSLRDAGPGGRRRAADPASAPHEPGGPRLRGRHGRHR